MISSQLPYARIVQRDASTFAQIARNQIEMIEEYRDPVFTERAIDYQEISRRYYQRARDVMGLHD